MPKKSRFKNMDAQGRRITEPYVKLTKNLLSSPAWKHMSPGARCIYIAIRDRYNGSNNGEISLSCREGAAVIHGSKSTASQKLRELIEHGFIKPKDMGMFTYKMATTWILTNEIYNNQSPSNEWKQWTPQKQNEVPVWKEAGPVLVDETYQLTREGTRNPDAIGKHRRHWASLFRLMQMRLLQERLQEQEDKKPGKRRA